MKSSQMDTTQLARQRPQQEARRRGSRQATWLGVLLESSFSKGMASGGSTQFLAGDGHGQGMKG